MASKKKELTAKSVRLITEQGRYPAGGISGLYLKVTPTGSKSWVYRVMVAGKRKDIGLGAFPDVSLSQSRDKARSMKTQIEEGIDPLRKRKELQQAIIHARLSEQTFEEVAIQCHNVKKLEFKNVKHLNQWINTLETYAFPTIGKLSIDEIERHDVFKVLEGIWSTKTETATRVRQRIAAVFDHALASGARTKSNPANWKGCLQPLLPSPEKLRKRQGQSNKHLPALPQDLMQDFMKDLRQVESNTARVLELSILCAMRSGEVRMLTWDEVDFENKCINLPDERMKSDRAHTFTLSTAAISVLKLMKAQPKKVWLQSSNYVFPNRKGVPLSDAIVGKLVRTLNEKRIKNNLPSYTDPDQDDRVATPHGFRSTFKVWAMECTQYRDEVSELVLAHVSADKTRAAYARSSLLDQRAKMMEDWGVFCMGQINKPNLKLVK